MNVKRHLTATTLALAAATLPVPAAAAPVQLDQAAWDAAVAGLTVVNEDFSGFALGSSTGPLTLVNATYTATRPLVASGEMFVGTCFADRGNCLSEGLTILDPRTFSDLPVGTTAWAVDVGYRAPGDLIRATVTGGSGTQVFEGVNQEFWAFGDPLGLHQVTFETLGTGTSHRNYWFDDVRTASRRVAPVPEPATLLLLAPAVAAVVARRRRS